VAPSDPVRQGSQDEGADGAGEVAHAERSQGRDDGQSRVVGGEEDRGEDQRRGLGVDEEVVELQHRADAPGPGGPPADLVRLAPVAREWG